MARYRFDENPPVWAGVVVRRADGTIYAIQMAPTHCVFERELDEHDDLRRFGDDRYYLPRREKVRVEIEGLPCDWNHGAHIPAPEEIEPTRKAIEA